MSLPAGAHSVALHLIMDETNGKASAKLFKVLSTYLLSFVGLYDFLTSEIKVSIATAAC